MKHVTSFRARYPTLDKAGNHKVVTFWLEARAAAAFVQARDHLDTLKPGAQLVLTDAGRSYETQAALRKAKPTLAARPGTSWHEAGCAIDIDTGHLGEALASVLHQYSPNTLDLSTNTRPLLQQELHLLWNAAQKGRQALVEAYMAQFGWHRPLLNEPWHLQHLPTQKAMGSVKAGITYIQNTEGRA